MQNKEELMRRTLVAAICCDMIQQAMRSIGRLNTADPTQMAIVAYSAMLHAAQRQQEK